MSGDASFYSGTKKLVLELEKEKIKYNILPGISSVSYMSAKTGVPLDEAGFLSLHGRKMYGIEKRGCIAGKTDRGCGQTAG
jgi:precorrin-6Y C5,15-methyltransferase (decarboxylating)